MISSTLLSMMPACCSSIWSGASSMSWPILLGGFVALLIVSYFVYTKFFKVKEESFTPTHEIHVQEQQQPFVEPLQQPIQEGQQQPMEPMEPMDTQYQGQPQSQEEINA